MEDLIKLAKEGYFHVAEFSTWKEYMEVTAGRLYQLGDVTDGFSRALIAREESYPTGLETMSLTAAIPHAEFQYVNRELVDITVFNSPVAFHRMDEPEIEVSVEVACMLLLKEPHAHLKALQELMQLFQSKSFPKILKVKTKEELLELLKEVEGC